MIEMVEKEVDGTTYKIEQFPTSKAIKILTQLGNLLGPSLQDVMGGSGVKDKSEQSRFFGKAIGELLSRMDKEQNVALAKQLVESCLRGEGAKINFELDFRGQLGHLLKLLVAVLEVNYSNFLDDLLGILDGVKGSNFAAQSTGQSGASSSQK